MYLKVHTSHTSSGDMVDLRDGTAALSEREKTVLRKKKLWYIVIMEVKLVKNSRQTEIIFHELSE